MVKSVKMFLRVVLIAALPVTVSGMQNGLTFKEIRMAVIIALLMALNTYVNSNPVIESRGVMPLS